MRQVPVGRGVAHGTKSPKDLRHMFCIPLHTAKGWNINFFFILKPYAVEGKEELFLCEKTKMLLRTLDL